MLALRALDGDLLPLAPHPNTDRKDDIMTDRPDHATEWIAAHEACEALGTFATAKHGDQIGLRPDIAAALGIETGAGDE